MGSAEVLAHSSQFWLIGHEKGQATTRGRGERNLSPAAVAEARKSEAVPKADMSSAADWVAVQTAASAAALAEARKGQAGPTAMVASVASSHAAEQAATGPGIG